MESQEILLQILVELRKLNNPKPMGLLEPGIKIYANRHNPPHLWYRLTSDKTVVGIPETAIRGYIKDLEIRGYERRGREVPKLLLRLSADLSYWIEAGFDSNFSKGILSAIASLSPDQLQDPITIAVKAGDDDAVLFSRVYVGDEPVNAPYAEITDWAEVTDRVIAVVKLANGITDDEPEEPPAYVSDTLTGQTALPVQSEPVTVDYIRQLLKVADSLGAIAKVETLWKQNRSGVAVIDGAIDSDIAAAKRKFSGPTHDVSDLILAIGVEIERIGWGKRQGSDHLQKTYGKKTRAELTEDQLGEVLGFLKGQPSKVLEGSNE